jgi:uncharacterized glyoxalase superfamily protein PhnB
MTTPHIHPVARYADARAAISYLERAFGFATRTVHDGPDGSVAHAELTFGTGAIGLSSVRAVDPANVWTTVREGIYVSMRDVDAHHARARAAGARIEHSPTDTDYGSRDYTARDPDGRLWSFGTYAMSDTEGPPVFIPELRSLDGDKTVAFLASAFGFERGLEVRDGTGRLIHAELWLGPSPLYVGGDDPGWRGRTQCTQVYVADPDAHEGRARAAGAEILERCKDTPYGARGYLAQDPEGFLWSFGTYRPQAPAAA